MTKEEIQALFARAEEAQKRREEQMPTVESALKQLHEVYQRLQDFGFKEMIYAPKNGTVFDSISLGCTGIAPCRYFYDKWMVEDESGIYFYTPTMFRYRPGTEPKFDFQI